MNKNGKQMNSILKRLLALVLCGIFLLGMMPIYAAALAEGTEQATGGNTLTGDVGNQTPGEDGTLQTGEVGNQTPGEDGALQTGEVGNQTSGEDGALQTGEVGNQTPGEDGALQTGEVGNQIPGEDGALQTGEVGNQIPGEDGTLQTGEVGNQTPGEDGALQTGEVDNQIPGEDGALQTGEEGNQTPGDGGALNTGTEDSLDNGTDTEKVNALFEKIMACKTIEEYNSLMEALTEEENLLLSQFSEEQNTALSKKMEELGAYGIAPLDDPPEEVNPDSAFLWVTKTFVGISEIPSEFSISVGDIQYGADKAQRTTLEDGSIVLKWKVPVAASASYQIRESGAEVDNFFLTANPSGVLSEEGVTVSVDVSRVIMNWEMDINECNNTVFTLSKDHVFIVAAKSNVIVISAAPLGTTARTAIINEIKTFSGDFKHNNGSTVFFYQISQYAGQTISIDGTNVTVSEDGSSATIGATKEWTKVKNYQYGYEAAQSDISITNTYSPSVSNLTVRKTVSGNMYDANKEFTFTISSDKEMTFGETTSTTITVNLKKDEEVTIRIPVGAAVTVSEDPNGYSYSLGSITDGVTTEDRENGVSFVMPSKEVELVINNDKTVTVDTGISLETMPYILILGVVAVGAVLLIMKRRNRYDD